MSSLINDRRRLNLNAKALLGQTFLSRSFARMAPRFLLTLGISMAAMPALAANFDVSNADQLSSAVENARSGDTITFRANITVSEAGKTGIIRNDITINGNGFKLQGEAKANGFYVESGSVTINNLDLSNLRAKGGNGGAGLGGGGGGGGAGMGGALFVGKRARVALNNVTLRSNSAVGGYGGYGETSNWGYGGGGGGHGPFRADGIRAVESGGAGGRGNGGHGAGYSRGDDGGLGGGGGGSWYDGGHGGLGGGAGGSTEDSAVTGGFLGGNGGAGYIGRAPSGGRVGYPGGGGGGAGLGGAIFVEDGGAVIIGGTFDLRGSTVAGGKAGAGNAGAKFRQATDGQSAGAGMFLAGTGRLYLESGAGQTQTISDVIIDQTGAGGTGADAGSWGLTKNGEGALFLTGANAYTGVTRAFQGILSIERPELYSGGTELYSDQWNAVPTTLILNNMDTDKGGTIIWGGRLFINGNATNAGGITVRLLKGILDIRNLGGTIKNDSIVEFNQTGPGNFSGVMSGSGSLSVTGSDGRLTLSGANTYTGTTTVTSGGTLEIASSANLGPATSPVALDNGTLIIGSGPFNRAITVANRGAIGSGNTPVTVNSLISGSGGLDVTAGTINLAANNTFAGGLRVIGDGAKALFTTDANLGPAGAVTLMNGGLVGTTEAAAANLTMTRTLNISGSGGVSAAMHPLIWSGSITGSGQFIKDGAGILVLTGNNTYSGGTRVRGGTLQVASDDKLGAAGSAITLDSGSLWATQTFSTARPVILGEYGGGFQLEAGNTLTLTGDIRGGQLRSIGNGTLVLNGTSSYKDILSFGGNIVGNTDTLKGNIGSDWNPENINTRTVTFDQAVDGTFAGNFQGVGSDPRNGLGQIVKTGPGKLTLTGQSMFAAQQGSIGEFHVQQGALQGNSFNLLGRIQNEGAVIFDQNFNGTYAGSINGTGTLAKEGQGLLKLTGISSVGGGTSVNAGVLSVNGHLTSNVRVNDGGTLQGVGNITGNVTNVGGGVIAPGNSVGTITVDGNFTMAPDSTYRVELNGQTSDRVQVTGTANIQSSDFRIEHDTDRNAPPVLPGKTYTILTTGGGLTVTSPEVGIADFPFLNFTLSADALNGYLTTSRSAEAFADLATTPNQKAVAGALDLASAGNPVWQQVVGATEAQAQAAFTSLSGASIHANAVSVLAEHSQFLRDAVLARLRQGAGVGTVVEPVANVLPYASQPAHGGPQAAMPAKAPVAAPSPGEVYAIWAQAVGSDGSLGGNGNAAKTDMSLGGIISGVDVTFNDMWRFGIAGGFSQSNFDSDDIAASGSSDNYHIALYGAGRNGAWSLRGGAGFSWNDVSTTRQVSVVNINQTQTGDDDLSTTQVFGELGYEVVLGTSILEPFANLAYVHIDGDVSEVGTTAVSGSTGIDTTFATLGVRGSAALTDTLTARGTLAWRHAFGDITPTADLTFSGESAPFTLAGTPIARDALVVEAGLDLRVATNGSLGVSWAGQYGDDTYNNAFTANFSWRF
ncbi:outer membrane autotransporter protein [Angulomicrobium tetraedrale]|uniref:Outer membrane autotransporter protein n=1 Tax=Ancylobacter tetraedralis TaxID=217068 RepID=A0A839ZG72_9HYPH|nr:autotransporter domain-containing protein [Ancylobacter tetraedralis]MBB3773774.1 outer membrane autotransporter protein [Ancylobacter tetraedralis]